MFNSRKEIDLGISAAAGINMVNNLSKYFGGKKKDLSKRIAKKRAKAKQAKASKKANRK